MTTRTTQSVVHFSSAFPLPGFKELQPAGEYTVDIDEEMIEAGSHLAWHRVGAFIHLPAIGVPSRTYQTAPMNTADLDAALKKDQERS